MISEKVVYVLADASTPHWSSFCKGGVERWCGRMGAELVYLPAPAGYQPQWVLFDAFADSVRRQLALGDGGVVQAVWIDSDIIVQDNAPDLFTEFPDKLFLCPPDPVGRVHPKMKRGYREWGMYNPRPYVITAIAKWRARHVVDLCAWFESNRDRFPAKSGDQELLTVGLYDTETHHALFPQDMHRMSSRVTAGRWETPFLHAAGGGKVKKLKKLRKGALRNKG